MGFADNIRRLREQHRLTQKEFGAIAGVSDKAISKWETNNGDARMGAIKRICDHFGLKKSDLIDELIPTRPVTPSDYKCEIIGDIGGVAYPTSPISTDSIGEVWKVPEQHYLPIIGMVRAGSGGIAFEDPQGYATVDQGSVPSGSRYFYLRVKGESMSPEIMPGDLALVREQPEVEYGELAVVIVNGEEGTIKRIFPKNGEVFLQATNPCYNRTEKADNVKIVGKVKQTIRKY